MNELPHVDHRGKDYGYFSRMCQAYRISPARVVSRLRRGWDVYRALCTPCSDIEYDKKPQVPINAVFGKKESKYLKHLSDRLQRSEYINALNKDIKNIAKTFLTQIHESTVHNEISYGLWLPYDGYLESVTCLLNLHLKLRGREPIKVFNHAMVISQGEPMRLFCTGDMLELFDGAEGLQEILRYLLRFGIHLYIKEDDFFLGFKDWGRLHFTKRKIDLYEKI